MKQLRTIALLVLALSIVLFSFASCDMLEDVATRVPGLENILNLLPGNDAHVHAHEAVVTAPTCTEAGYTTYTCTCGDSYVADETEPSAHSYEAVVTAPTCTEAGYTTYTCTCGDSYVADETEPSGHSYVETVITAPTCSATGLSTFTCTCGDSYEEELATVDHIDTNLDITCDFDGCTKRILPAADSEISLFTAKNMIIISLSNSYYMQGVVTEVRDAHNGIFIITDEAGDTILVRIPKNADGASYSAWTTKVVLGDTIRLYGKPTKNTDTTTSSTYPAKVEGAVLTVLNHEHSFTLPTCLNPGKCACLALGEDALGHIDENDDGFCDRCTFNMNMKISEIAIRTDAEGNGVLDDNKTKWQWSDDTFTVEISKGASTYTLYTSAKAYMQLKKQNNFTVYNTTGANIQTITLYATNDTQFKNLKAALGDLTFTADETDFSVTITVNSSEDFTFSNVGTQTAYISGAKIVYEPATEA